MLRTVFSKPLILAGVLVFLYMGAQATQLTAQAKPTRTDVPTLFDATDGSTDYLHTPIPANPVLDPNNATMLAAANVNTNIPIMAGPQWVIPIYRTDNTYPNYNPYLSNASAWGCSVGGSIRLPAGATRELPGNGDAWIVSVNTDDSTVKAIWVANKLFGTWMGSCGGSYSLHSNGFTKIVGVGNGSGAQEGAGMILFSELASGVIPHALHMTTNITCSTFRAPATKSDGHTAAPNCVPMGSRVQLNPSVNCSTIAGASAGEKMVCQAMETYGAYIVDTGGTPGLTGIDIQGDDLTDPSRSPWQTPGNGERGTRNCAPVSATCGQDATVGIIGSNDLSHIPWANNLRILANWNGQ